MRRDVTGRQLIVRKTRVGICRKNGLEGTESEVWRPTRMLSQTRLTRVKMASDTLLRRHGNDPSDPLDMETYGEGRECGLQGCASWKVRERKHDHGLVRFWWANACMVGSSRNVSWRRRECRSPRAWCSLPGSSGIPRPINSHGQSSHPCPTMPRM